MHAVHLIARPQIAAGLRELGVESGDTVMVHASVGAVGWVLGGAQEALGGLIDAVGASGTVMMYVGWEGSPYDLAVEARTLPQSLLDLWPAYDPATSHAVHSWSVLAEYLRTWPGAKRSAHPDSSFAAVGARADEMTRDHPLHYGMGPGSPLAKLCDVGGKVLLLGAPFSSVTLLHHAEHLADVPDKKVVHYQAPILRNGQKEWVEIEEFSTTGCLPWFGSEDLFDVIVRAYVQDGRGAIGQIGGAVSYLFDAADLVAFAVDWIEERFAEPTDWDLDIQVRAAGPDDHRALVDLYGMLEETTSGEPTSPSRASSRVDELIEDRDKRVFVAIAADDIVGMIVASKLSADRGAIDHAFVDPEHRGRGILRELEMDASGYLRDLGCCTVELHVGAENEGARAAWEALGYAPTLQTMERPLG